MVVSRRRFVRKLRTNVRDAGVAYFSSYARGRPGVLERRKKYLCDVGASDSIP